MSDYGEDAEMGQLLAEKERELIALSRARIQRLEEQMRGKEQLCEDLKAKLEQMQEDFNYNLSLIDGRDAELEELERKLEVLKTACREKEIETEELRDALRSADDRIRSFEDRRKSSERQLQDNRETLREQLSAIQWEKADILKRKDEEIKAVRADYEARLRDKELEVITATKDSSQSLEVTLRSREEQVQGLKAQLAQSQSQQNSLRSQLEEVIAGSQEAGLLEDRVRVLQDQNEALHKKYDAVIKEKTEAFFKADQEARALRFSEQALKQELAHLQSMHEEDKLAQQREVAQLKEQQERELAYISQIKEASLEKMQMTHALQLKRIQEKLAEAVDDNERLALQCQTLKGRAEDAEQLKAQEMEETRDNAAAEIAKMKKNVVDLRGELAEKSDEMSLLALNLDRSKAALAAQDREIRRLESDLESAQTRNSDFERSAETRLKQRQAKDQSSEVDTLQRLLRKREEEVERLKEALQSTQTDLEAAHMENQDLEVSTRQRLASDLRDAQEASRKKDFETTFKDKSSRQELEIARLTAHLQDLENTLRSAEEEQRRTESTLQAKEAELAARDKELSRLKALMQSLKSDLAKATEERDQLIEVSSALRAELNMMRSSVDLETRGSGEGFRRALGLGPYTQPIEDDSEVPASKSALPKYDRFEEVSISPPVKDSHLSTLKRKISLVKTELDQNFDLSAAAKPRSRLFARLEDTPVSSLANTQSFEERE